MYAIGRFSFINRVYWRLSSFSGLWQNTDIDFTIVHLGVIYSLLIYILLCLTQKLTLQIKSLL